MQLCRILVFALWFFGALTATCASHPTYDHQTVTYHADHKPATVQDSSATVTPFFSPDHSVDTLTKLVEAATKTLDVGTPSFSSWSGCTPFNANCSGCTPEYMRNNEAFPVWQALLNAIHRGVHVRILTNNFEELDCPGKTSPLTFLAVAGAEVHSYATTAFLHTKYINADKKRAAVSSVNFSYTSFMKNREAGMIIQDSEKLVGFLNDMFEFDWNRGIKFPINQQYSKRDLDIIRDPTPIRVKLPEPNNFSCNAASPLPQPIKLSSSFARIFANPDFAYDLIMESVRSAKKSLVIELYQITDDNLCDLIIQRFNDGLDIDILVSDYVFDKEDYYAAEACYKKMYFAGYRKLRKTAPKCLTFSHQKFWVVDGDHLYMSTGNLSPTDMPSGSAVFPAYPDPNWRKVNRDYTVHIVDAQVVQVFMKVYDLDSQQGYIYHPKFLR